MSTVQVKLSKRVVDAALAFKPDYDSNTAHLSRLLELAIDSQSTLGKQPERAAYISNSLELDKEEKERAHALSLETINHPPAKAKPIDPALELHCDLIRDFWKAKKGSKGDRSWNLLQTGLKAIQKAYGDSVVKEQLELAINGRWQSITLANYERFRPTKQHLEPVQNHPAQKVFKASDLGPEWERNAPPSVTGGKGVLEGMF